MSCFPKTLLQKIELVIFDKKKLHVSELNDKYSRLCIWWKTGGVRLMASVLRV